MSRLDERVRKMRLAALTEGREPVPDAYQGVTKDRIRTVLNNLGIARDDMIDGVFALLDDSQPSWFSKAPANATFSDGASTAHLACHVGILQRGETKLDREGRDYWIKPLRDLGAIDLVYLDSKSLAFVPGHPVAKSPNSAYKLSASMKELLLSSEEHLMRNLRAWASEDEVRRRSEFQAKVAKEAATHIVTNHADLIAATIKYYVPMFLVGYEPIYVDASDGERITSEERARLAEAGIDIGLADAMPDVLLWNSSTDALWVIEAVTSDGEVDNHKVEQMRGLARRFQKPRIDFTTTYQTWKVAASRQGRHRNIAPGSYVWICEDPSKHFLVESFAGKD